MPQACGHVIAVAFVVLQGCASDTESSARVADAGIELNEDAGGGVEAGGPDAEPPSQPTTRVIRGDPSQTEWWDLRLIGEGLGEWEGRAVKARIGMPDRPPERLGAGEVAILNGSFAMFFPEVWEASLYKQKLLFVDVNGNGTCDPEVDRAFADLRGTPDHELSLPNGVPTRASMDESSDPEAHCQVLNSVWPEE